ncbi:hypothetical protein AVEN_109505-1 [Araneus ventricosus]|uniref:Uncharacterized protein n=1 Tax=Araneus ventricosus TaxID=182803 RepID=A0A4Y2FZR9_ARAVE|nr:hypothetical protein AVEN_109505-1 [Araneus ventricosus]
MGEIGEEMTIDFFIQLINLPPESRIDFERSLSEKLHIYTRNKNDQNFLCLRQNTGVEKGEHRISQIDEVSFKTKRFPWEEIDLWDREERGEKGDRNK